jgi:hypothetical protein
LVIGTAGEQLDQTVAYIQADQPSRFGNNSFFRSVSRTTRDGTFTVAMDAKAWMDQTRRRNAQVVPGLRQLGFESISAMVASNGFTDQAANRALRLDFQAGREGMFRWMGAPAPLSTPSVMAGNTWFFAGMRTDEPATIVRDLLMLTDAEDSEDTSTTAALESLAASLGNEVGLGIGRPLLPMPRVRLALEVKDGPRFLSSLCVLLQAADADNTMRVQLVRRGGRDVVRFEHPRTSLPIAVGIARDQAVFTFGEAALEEVWRDIEGNNTLANSNHFRHAMPAKSGTHASMVVYHQPSAQGGELQGLLQLIGATTPPLDSTTLQPPAVLYAVADGDRIDLYGDGIRNQWDLGRLVSSGTALMARNGGEE